MTRARGGAAKRLPPVASGQASMLGLWRFIQVEMLMRRLGLICRAALAATPLFFAAAISNAADLQCADKPVMARGNGFSPSPEQSQEAARKEWLKKATEIYPDATFENAKDPQMQCANQGLYSNCAVSAIPCGAAKEASKAPEGSKQQ